jgi:hypothetical protein
MSWEDNIASRIFTPLGMSSSSVDPKIVADMKNIATGHMTLSDGSNWVLPSDWPYHGWMDTYGPAGNIRSNVIDMAQWLRLQLGRGTYKGETLLSTENLGYTHAPKTPVTSNPETGESASYASGWINQVKAPYPLIWHNGGTMGMHSIVAFVPATNIGLVVLTTTNSNSLPEIMALFLHDLYFDNPVDNTKLQRELEAIPMDMLRPFRRPFGATPPVGITPQEASDVPLDSFIGKYTNPAYGTFRVKRKGDSLVMVMGPLKIEAPLTQFKPYRFLMTLPDFPEGDMEVVFSSKKGSPPDRLVIEALGDVNNGVFTRIE